MYSESEISSSLRKLRQAIDSLVRCSTVLADPAVDEETEILSKLKSIAGRIYYSEILANRQVVAIAGLQGVGKSTLLGNYLGLSGTYFPENVGRGEKVPVLISWTKELSLSEWVIEVQDGDLRMLQREVSEDEFRRSVTGGGNAILMEVGLPHEYLEAGGSSLLLLPGLEEVDEEWTRLTEHAFVAASACVFVTNSAVMADRANEELLNKVGERFSSHSIVAISGADRSSMEEINDVKERIGEILRIPKDAQETRILAVGVGEELCNRWIPALRDSLAKVGIPDRAATAHRLRDLTSLVDNELGRILRDLKRRLDSHEIDATNNRGEIANFIQVFDERVHKVRESYLRKVRQAARKHGEQADDILSERIQAENWFTKAWTLVAGEDLEKVREAEKAVWEAWESAGVLENLHPSILAKVAGDSMGLAIRDQGAPLGHALSLEAYDLPRAPQAPLAQGIMDGSHEPNEHYFPAILHPEAEKVLRAFLGRPGASPIKPGDLTEQSRQVVAAIPSLALEYARLSTVVTGRSTAGPDRPSEPILAEEIEKMGSAQKRVLGAVGALLVADGAYDGTIDSIPNLLTALGAPVAAGPWVFGGLAVAGAGLAINRAAIRRDLSRWQAHRAAIASVEQSVVDALLENFDERMEMVRERLMERLGEAYRVDASWVRRMRASLALAQATEIRNDLREVLANARAI